MGDKGIYVSHLLTSPYFVISVEIFGLLKFNAFISFNMDCTVVLYSPLFGSIGKINEIL